MEQTMNLYLRYDGEGNDLIDTHQHHFEEGLVFAWYGMIRWSEGSRERED